MTGLVSVHTLATLCFFRSIIRLRSEMDCHSTLSFLHYLLSSMLVQFKLIPSTPEFFHPRSPPVSNTLVTMMQLFSFLYLFPIRYTLGLRVRGTGLV